MNIIKPAYSWNGELKKRTDTKFAIVHHAEASNCTVEDIHKWHQENGWVGIGYSFFIKKDGTVYEGRPTGTIGAHTQGYNDNSIGICLEGNYEVEQIPTIQGETLVALLVDLQSLYPNIRIIKHKSVNQTQCPGKNFNDELLLRAMRGAGKMNFDEALQLLVEKGVVNSPEYWKQAVAVVKNLDQLIINFANKIK